MFRNLYFSAALLALPACIPEIPEGVIRCDPFAHSSCPKDWSCHADYRCYSYGPSEVDAGTSPATGDDAGTPDDPDADIADTGAARPIDQDPETDADLTDARTNDAGEAPDTSVPATCRVQASGFCADELFCNGTERCDPDDPKADARGCVAGTQVSCPSGQMCSEQRDMCSTCSDLPNDNDSDGDMHQAASCGGDDCDDNDAARRPGQPEICDARDNDCDGTVDGAPADMACAQAAPQGATARCVSGRCVPTCTDPDFDLVNGACVRHDDCMPNPCGAGTCMDGSRTFTCTCPVGYTGTGTTACKDIDECAEPIMHNCDTAPRAACVNKEGGFSCRCPEGAVGDGVGVNGCVRLCRDRPRCQEP